METGDRLGSSARRPMRRAATMATAALLAVTSVLPPAGAADSPRGTPAGTLAASPISLARLPAPDKPLPHRAGKVVRRLNEVSHALHVSLRRWVTRGHTERARRPPRAVIYRALYQQRLYRMLTKGKNRSLARRVLHRLHGPLERFSRATIRAGAGLRAAVTPLKPPIRMRTGRPAPSGDLLRFYKRGQRRFRVAWQVLAAVNFIETKFGRVKSRSPAGARGPMQFLPSTWRAYGLGGNILDPHDAILGAANLLHASGAPRDYRKALFAYNHSRAYVAAVLRYARQMRRDRLHYFAYYSWQVFVITTKGDIRLTGPRPR